MAYSCSKEFNDVYILKYIRFRDNMMSLYEVGNNNKLI